MPTECSADLFGFTPVEGREVVAAFDGGTITADAGALLLGRIVRSVCSIGLRGVFTTSGVRSGSSMRW